MLVSPVPLVLLAGCAHEKFDPAQVEPGARLGDRTFFRIGAFPAEFEDESEESQVYVEE